MKSSMAHIFILYFFIFHTYSCSNIKVNENTRGEQDVTMHITEFGAVPDDNIDDTHAFRKAIKYCGDSLKEIRLGKGVYEISDQIVVGKAVMISGEEGARIRINDNIKSQNVFWVNGQGGGRVEKLSLKGITIESERKKLNGILLQSRLNQPYVIQNCTFKGLGTALFLSGKNGGHILGCSFWNVDGAVRIIGGNNVEIRDNSCMESKNCFLFDDTKTSACQGVRVKNNRIEKMTNYPIHFSDVVDGHYHSDIEIRGNEIFSDTIPYESSVAGGSADQISIFGANNVKVSNNKSIGGGDMGITVQRCNDVEICFNECKWNARSGIVLSALGKGGEGKYSDFYIHDNILENNGIHPKGGHPKSLAGIYIENSESRHLSQVRVEDNFFGNNKNSRQRYNTSCRWGDCEEKGGELYCK